jgi:hypothetical protein
MNKRLDFEYDGFWMHYTDRVSNDWRQKGDLLVPPVGDFHKQFIIFKQLGLEQKMSNTI